MATVAYRATPPAQALKIGPRQSAANPHASQPAAPQKAPPPAPLTARSTLRPTTLCSAPGGQPPLPPTHRPGRPPAGRPA
ncbi:hypothetical protein [Hymenobacter aerophilus]|uniref:hypothetical protein n=1 Tax=Hymenobacter aerophilus TaxID=119644 RepID=UPI00039F3922|nr:hypothetical protein [Hymenobacter aerophilus]